MMPLQLNNFRELKGYGWRGRFKTFRQNKGPQECVAAFVGNVISGAKSV